MPYTTVSTRTSGYKILASDWNDVINNENWLGNADRCVAVTDTSTASVTASTMTLMTFATDDYDTGGFHSTVSNTSRLVVPTGYGGVYDIFANVYFDYFATTVKPIYLEVRKNAAGSSSGGTRVAGASCNTSTNSVVLSSASLFTQVRLAATDYIELFVMQETTGALSLKGTTQAHRFGMTWRAA